MSRKLMLYIAAAALMMAAYQDGVELDFEDIMPKKAKKKKK
jgi:hypothetical protein